MATSKSRKPPVAVLGAGAMGRAAVADLARAGHRVLVLDQDLAAARRVAGTYGYRRASADAVDARDTPALSSRLRAARAAVIVNAGPYPFNLPVMAAALEARCHYLDLGGLFHTTRVQLTHDADFRRHSLLAVLGMGSAPGITNVLARAAADPMPHVSAVRVYNGGADFTRYDAPLAFGFSPATILDEFTLDPVVFTRGRFRSTEPLSGGEDVLFDAGLQRVHLSLHSEVATLPLTYRGKGIRECFFKVAYDPGLVEKLKLLIALGLTDRRPGRRGVAPRDVLLDGFAALPRPPAFVDDRDCLAVVVDGNDEKGPVSVRYDLTARPERRPPLSAVARDTGFPPAIVAGFILDGLITERGVLPPERCVPVKPFLKELARRGMPARVSIVRPA
jgi:saccharopine dehydrogenase-like NADP-dependent oxidoreductase